MSLKPYIVLIGDVGAGKSTLVEKICDEIGRSSNADQSYTRSCEVIESYDRSLEICDTPGSNPMADMFQHNLHIAHALNYKHVSCVLIVAKADLRRDNTISRVREYAESFIPENLPEELIGVCITHMDTVNWTKLDLMPILHELGVSTAIFSSKNTPREELVSGLLNECRTKRPVALNIDGEKFLTIFKISNNNIKILRQVRKEVGRFNKMKEDFYRQRGEFTDTNDQMNMTFEFQTFMYDEIVEAQKRLSNDNNFSYVGDARTVASEAGHCANMTNQLRAVLRDIRIDASRYHKDVETEFRKCPYCPAVWVKIEGCDGDTECGSRPTTKYDDWSGYMSTFRFFWDKTSERLTIRKSNKQTVAKRNSSGQEARRLFKQEGNGAGCGRTINWSKMAPVAAPCEVNDAFSSTKDLAAMPAHHLTNWNAAYDNALKKLNPISTKRK